VPNLAQILPDSSTRVLFVSQSRRVLAELFLCGHRSHKIRYDHPEDQIARGNAVATIAETSEVAWPDFRLELASRNLPEDMIARLRSYGTEESFRRCDSYTWASHDRYVCVLEGEIHIHLPQRKGSPTSTPAIAKITSPEIQSFSLQGAVSKHERWFRAPYCAYTRTTQAP